MHLIPKRIAIFCGLALLAFEALTIPGEAQLSGNQDIIAANGQPGNLQVAGTVAINGGSTTGGLSVAGDVSDFGTTGSSGNGSGMAGVTFYYSDSGTNYACTLIATRPSA